MFALGLASFLLLGAVLVLVGSHQEALAEALDLDLASSGLLAASLMLGFAGGAGFSGPLADRLPRRPLFVGAAGLAAVALGTVHAEMSYLHACLAMGALGVGVGFHETLLNAGFGQRYGLASARPLTIAHSAANVSAMFAPLFFAFITRELDWPWGFRGVGLGYALLGVWGLGVSLEGDTSERSHEPRAGRVDLGLLPFAVGTAAYVGLETSITIFAVPYATGALELPSERGLAAISSFWFGLLLGRLALIVYRGRIDARVLILAGSASLFALVAGVGLRLSFIEGLVGVLGFCLGPTFPVLMALAAQRFPHSAGTAVGLVGAAGAVGGFGIPWLSGWLGDLRGPAFALLALSPWAAAIALSAWVTLRGHEQSD